MTKDLASQSERSSQLTSTCEDLTSQLSTRQTEGDDLRRQRVGLDVGLKEQQERTEKLQREVEEKEAQRCSIESQLFGVIKQVQERDGERRSLEVERQQDNAQWEERLLALQLSADTAVQAAEEEADRSAAAVAQLQAQSDTWRAELQAVQGKVMDSERRLALAESHRDSAKQSLKAMEGTCAGFLADLKLKDAEVRDAKSQLSAKEEELTALQHLFMQMEKDAEKGKEEEEEEEREDEERHRELNDSLVLLESAVQQSFMRRGGSDQSILAPALPHSTPAKPRRFVFVSHDQASASGPHSQIPQVFEELRYSELPDSPYSGVPAVSSLCCAIKGGVGGGGGDAAGRCCGCCVQR